MGKRKEMKKLKYSPIGSEIIDPRNGKQYKVVEATPHKELKTEAGLPVYICEKCAFRNFNTLGPNSCMSPKKIIRKSGLQQVPGSSKVIFCKEVRHDWIPDSAFECSGQRRGDGIYVEFIEMLANEEF